jgi:hypothetical protein
VWDVVRVLNNAYIFMHLLFLIRSIKRRDRLKVLAFVNSCVRIACNGNRQAKLPMFITLQTWDLLVGLTDNKNAWS